MNVSFGKQQNLQILEVPVSVAGSVCWCPEHPNSGAFHEGELPKETPSQVTTEPVSEDAVWEAGEKGCKFFTQSGRRSGEGGEARYSCFAMYL